MKTKSKFLNENTTLLKSMKAKGLGKRSKNKIIGLYMKGEGDGDLSYTRDGGFYFKRVEQVF